MPSRTRSTLIVLGTMATLAWVAGGCVREFTYKDAEGREYRYRNVGFDTSLERARIITPDGVTLELEKADSQSRAAENVGKALDLAREGVNKVP